MVLSILSYFECEDPRLDTIADHLLAQQMPDGGWNCQRPYGATHASLNTTISVLEGLRLYELHRGRKTRAIRAAQRRGREFLLVHRLFRAHRTGDVIKPVFTRFAFPPRWHYDILRALDYFQAVDALADRRLAEAIDIVRSSRREDGRSVTLCAAREQARPQLSCSILSAAATMGTFLQRPYTRTSPCRRPLRTCR